jgi:hypothetical protein
MLIQYQKYFQFSCIPLQIQLSFLYHFYYTCRDRDYGSKKHYVYCLKTALLTRKRTFYLTYGFERVLGRNARTSPEMIDRFYAAPLQGEMNIGELQSKRRPRPWE